MLLSSLCFALINICVKILSTAHLHFPQFQEYPVHELVFFRSITSLVICAAIIKSRKISFFGNNKKWLLIRGFSGVIALTSFFFTLQNLPIAIGTTVQYISPLFTVILAVFLQKEKVAPFRWIFFFISLSGIAVLGFMKDPTLTFNYWWLMLGLGSAMISALAYNSIIKCKNTDQPIVIVMYFPLIATPIMMLACLTLGFVVPQGVEWLMLLLIGILAQIAQVSMTRAFHLDEAAKVTPAKYVGAVYAVAAGYFIFDEELGFYTSVGIVLVLIGVLLNTFIKEKKKLVTQN